MVDKSNGGGRESRREEKKQENCLASLVENMCTMFHWLQVRNLNFIAGSVVIWWLGKLQ